MPEVDCETSAPDVNPAMHLMQHFFCRDIVIVRSSLGGRPLIMLMSYYHPSTAELVPKLFDRQ